MTSVLILRAIFRNFCPLARPLLPRDGIAPRLLLPITRRRPPRANAGIKAALNKCQQIISDDAPVIFGALPEMIVPVPNYLEGYVMQATDAQYPVRFWQLRLREH